MIDFQQITSWFSSISRLSNDVQPIIGNIRSETKTKTIDGIQFIDFEQPSFSNIRQLNAILRENGYEEIDEDLLAPSLLDIEKVLERMQQDFTQDELASAIQPPFVPNEGKEFSDAELGSLDLCLPQVESDQPEFSEKELIDAACDPPAQEPKSVTEVGSIPTTQPTVDLGLNEPLVPEPSDDVFQQLVDASKNAPSSDIFPKNAPDCIAKMQEVAKSVQQKVNEYTDAKNRIQEILLDYYYETIANAYYQSFLDGYQEAKRLVNIASSAAISAADLRAEATKKILSMKEDYSSVQDRSGMQKKMEEVVWKFSNQFDIKIDGGFLGLFQSYPSIEPNRKILPLAGRVKDIPDELNRYLNDVPKDSSDSASKISDQAKKSENALDAAFVDAVSGVKRYSFGFGFNWFLQNEPIDQDLAKAAEEQRAIQEGLSKRYTDLKKRSDDAQAEIEKINGQIAKDLADMNCKSKQIPAKVEPGKDLNFKNVSKNPTIFDYSWWVKFSQLATLVNLVPVHWPIGLIIPSPTGIIKIPFPVFWFPIFVAPTDTLIAVLFIGQCGILPCPYLFLQHFLPVPIGPFQSNNPYFAVAIGGPVNISSHEPLPPLSLPSFDLVFPALDKILDQFRRGITIDTTTLFAEVQNQLEGVQRSVDQYLALSQKDAQAIIENAKNQANQTLQSAKKTAEDAIRQAQADGRRLIEDARARYRDANALSNATLAITQGVQQRINDATRLVEDAASFATTIITDAQNQANGVKKRAEDTVNGIIENGKQAYRQKIQEIQQLKQEYTETVQALNNLLDRIKVPAIGFGSIDLSVLLSSFSLALGSLRALAADLSPRAIQFGFPTEISPSFSASLPMLRDELPPWERLSITNIPLLFFLWKWCKAGKYVGGFFPESIVGPI